MLLLLPFTESSKLGPASAGGRWAPSSYGLGRDETARLREAAYSSSVIVRISSTLTLPRLPGIGLVNQCTRK